MSNSSLVNITKLSPNNSGTRTHSIDRITPHCVVGQASAETIGSCFASTAAQASCNYGIGTDGRVVLVVDESKRSWCSSSTSNDQRAVTIECASDATDPYAFNDAVYNKLVDLCADICKRNGKSKLIWISDKNTALNYSPKADEMLLTVHRWFANKACPGDWMMNRMGNLASTVTSRLGGSSSGTTPNVTPSTSTGNSYILKGQQEACKFTGKSIACDGIRGAETRKMAAMVLQTAINKDYGKGLVVDGIFGTKSKLALGSHYVAKGERQYMVTAAEILLYLIGKNPNGVEYPGTFGNGLASAAGTTKITSAMFLNYLN